MSRIRSVHPGLWTDERFVSLSPFARILFIGIWSECDDWGSFEWSPLKLKMRLLPADAVDVAPLLDELAAVGCVLRYEIDGRKLGAVRNFCRFQRPKKPNSTYPQPAEVLQFVDTEARSTRDGSEPVGNQSGTASENSRQMKDEGGRREDGDCKRNTRGGGAAAERGRRISGDFVVPDDWIDWAVAEGLVRADAQHEAARFLDYWRAMSGKQGVKSDWLATWRNWIRRSDRLPANGGSAKHSRGNAGEYQIGGVRMNSPC